MLENLRRGLNRVLGPVLAAGMIITSVSPFAMPVYAKPEIAIESVAGTKTPGNTDTQANAQASTPAEQTITFDEQTATQENAAAATNTEPVINDERQEAEEGDVGPKEHEISFDDQTEAPADEDQEEETVEFEDDGESVLQFTMKNPLVFPETEQSTPEELDIEQAEVTEIETTNGIRRIPRRDTKKYTNVQEAGEVLKQALMNHETSITIPVSMDVPVNDDDYIKYSEYYSGRPSENSMRIIKLAVILLQAASDYTGIENEGDYILYNFGSFDYYFAETIDGDRCDGNLVLSNISYLITDKEQQKVDDFVDTLIEENHLDTMTDYDKIKFVYDYLYNHVSYDLDHYQDDNYLQQFSAYGALIDGKAVCQGYANAFYYIMNRLGIPTRIISRDDNKHTWLITKLNGKFYNLDPTWDGDKAPDTDSYLYFLKGSNSFRIDHIASADYTSEDFTSQYPIDENDYVFSTINISDSEIELDTGESHTLEVQVSDHSAVTFISSDTNVAIVNRQGKITGVNPGVATILVKSRNNEATCKVTVSQKYAVTMNTVDNVTAKLTGGGSYHSNDIVRISADQETSAGYIFSEWQFSENVQFVEGYSKTSNPTAFYMPSDNLLASAKYNQMLATAIILDTSSVTLSAIGDSKKVTYTVVPQNAVGNVTIETDNALIASVSQDGTITANGYGTAVITFTSGNAKATCNVTVQAQTKTITVIGRTTSGAERTQTKSVKVGDTITISVPAQDGTGYNFKEWQSDYARLQYANGTSNKDLKISFIMPPVDVTMRAIYEETPVSSVSLNRSSLTMTVGDTFVLSAAVSPSNALAKTVTFTTSDSSVANVSSSGQVSAYKAGTATITATAGNVKATCTVTVNAPVETTSNTSASNNSTESYLRLNAASLKMYVGNTYPLKVSSSNVGTVTYESSDTSVATVSASGVVTGVGAGTCTVTARGSMNGKSDSVPVTVVNKDGTTTNNTNGTTGANGTANANGTGTGADGTQSGTINGPRVYTEDELTTLRASAVKSKADADKTRADALKNARFESDGSAKELLASLRRQRSTGSTSGSNTSDNEQQQAQTWTVSGQVNQETVETEATEYAASVNPSYRNVASSPTGDAGMLQILAYAMAAGAGLVVIKKKSRE